MGMAPYFGCLTGYQVKFAFFNFFKMELSSFLIHCHLLALVVSYSTAILAFAPKSFGRVYLFDS
jgi:hypothetical protein